MDAKDKLIARECAYKGVVELWCKGVILCPLGLDGAGRKAWFKKQVDAHTQVILDEIENNG